MTSWSILDHYFISTMVEYVLTYVLITANGVVYNAIYILTLADV